MALDSSNAEIEPISLDEHAPEQASQAAHLVFLPDRDAPAFFLWGEAASRHPLSAVGTVRSERLANEALVVQELSGVAIPLLIALPQLAGIPADVVRTSPHTSLSAWSLAAKFALDLIARERLVPRVIKNGRAMQARTCIALSTHEDHERFAALAKSFPLASHAVPATARSGDNKCRIWTAEALLRAFLDCVADELVRKANHFDASAVTPTWAHRFLAALCGPAANFAPEGFQERSLLAELESWVEPVTRSDALAPRACFRLELPETAETDVAAKFYVRFLLQSADGKTEASALEVFGRKKSLAQLQVKPRIAEERLLQDLRLAARIFAPIEQSLHEARPEGVVLNAHVAWNFIDEAAPILREAGMRVTVPREFEPSGQRRLRMRMRIGATKKRKQEAATSISSLRQSLSFVWEARLGDTRLSARQLDELAELKGPLARYRGRWVVVQRREIERAAELLDEGGGELSGAAALAAALGETAPRDVADLPVEVTVEGQLERVLEELRRPADEPLQIPADFVGQLRPYQERGVTWLAHMARIGLGACLADDMGLGKTIQLLAFLLYRRANNQDDRRPILLVCPTSVLGNWQRELAKFAPTLNAVQHYGAERARDADVFTSQNSPLIVMTSYGLLRRDAELLKEIEWSAIVLDEAQNIKNPDSRTARVARSLHGEFRVAMTGTPVENRLTELWSIFEFLNPGLLGPLAKFQREMALPIERFGRDDLAEKLKRIVRPLLLRRTKNDPTIIQDLPSKQEMEEFCTLTREQASLYRTAVDEAMEHIEGADGIERRGHVLALITALKQICNHPSQYLHEVGPLVHRSGKLQRLCEMLDEVVANGERALVFTQYREMGDRLVRELRRVLGVEVLFLHGGTPRAQRDAMIKRFQEAIDVAPPIFVLSLKAGGTGLNLTAATHVFHYDRWWNPAVEDQATDRAYRIGQKRHVQVHKFLCAGTIEEKVDALLRSKRDLAAQIVGHGEQWITELDNAQLRDLFALSSNAVIDGDVNQDLAEDAA